MPVLYCYSKGFIHTFYDPLEPPPPPLLLLARSSSSNVIPTAYARDNIKQNVKCYFRNESNIVSKAAVRNWWNLEPQLKWTSFRILLLPPLQVWGNNASDYQSWTFYLGRACIHLWTQVEGVLRNGTQAASDDHFHLLDHPVQKNWTDTSYTGRRSPRQSLPGEWGPPAQNSAWSALNRNCKKMIRNFIKKILLTTEVVMETKFLKIQFPT